MATFDTEKLIFVGDYTDYYADGIILEKGHYSKEGVKQGYFRRYFDDGTLYSEGQFVNGDIMGVWKYYYENGTPKETIEFTASDYKVLEYTAKSGKQNLIGGSGTWIYPLQIKGYVFPVLIGEFRKGQKVG